MRKREISILLITLIVIIASTITMKLVDAQTTCVKITSREDIPNTIWDELKKAKLERGVYFFNREFTGNVPFFAVCSGEQYDANTYDIEVEEVNYRMLSGSQYGNKKHIDRGQFAIQIKESSAGTTSNYYSEFDYPVLLFRLKKKQSNEDYLRVLSDETELPINYWWGSDSIEGEGEGCTYKVIKNKKNIPTDIWQRIQALELRHEREAYLFYPRDFDTDALYILVVGDWLPYEYSVAFIDAKIDYYEDVWSCTVKLREYSNKGTLPYYEPGNPLDEDFKNPFAVLRINPVQNKSPRIVDLNVISYDDHAFPYHSYRCSIEYKNK